MIVNDRSGQSSSSLAAMRSAGERESERESERVCMSCIHRHVPAHTLHSAKALIASVCNWPWTRHALLMPIHSLDAIDALTDPAQLQRPTHPDAHPSPASPRLAVVLRLLGRHSGLGSYLSACTVPPSLCSPASTLRPTTRLQKCPRLITFARHAAIANSRPAVAP